MPDLLFKMTRQRALELGLIRCKTCGHPPNNHFEWLPRPCAHCKCVEYVEGAVFGVELIL